MREHASLKDLLEKSRALETARKQLDDNRELATSRDVEIAAMADDEIPELEKRVSDLERDFQIALVPAGSNGRARRDRGSPRRDRRQRSRYLRRRSLPDVSSLRRSGGTED